MIFPGMAGGQADAAPARIAFLQIPDMIKLGETWKFIELPRAIDPEKPVIASVSGIRSMLFDRANNVQPRDAGGRHRAQGPGRLRRQERQPQCRPAGAREGPVSTSAGSRYLRAVVKASKNPTRTG